MKNEPIREHLFGVWDLLLRAKYFHLSAIFVSMFVQYKSDHATALIVMFVLSYYAATIGIQELNIDACRSVMSASTDINEIVYEKITDDTERLISIRNNLAKENKTEALREIELLVNDNIQTSNTIKAARNVSSYR